MQPNIPKTGELSKQGEKINLMDEWCNEIEIKATPTIFLNGYQLPDAYSIEDLQYFLLELFLNKKANGTTLVCAYQWLAAKAC